MKKKKKNQTLFAIKRRMLGVGIIIVHRREGHVITTATSQHRLNTCLISDTTRAIHFTIKERQGTDTPWNGLLSGTPITCNYSERASKREWSTGGVDTLTPVRSLQRTVAVVTGLF